MVCAVRLEHADHMAHETRVKVFLTRVGGGAFGNSDDMINAAIQSATNHFKSFPIDVIMVNFDENKEYTSLGKIQRTDPSMLPSMLPTHGEFVFDEREHCLPPPPAYPPPTYPPPEFNWKYQSDDGKSFIPYNYEISNILSEQFDKNPIKIFETEVKAIIWELRNIENNDLISCDFGYQVFFI
jgi:hypothetical protein